MATTYCPGSGADSNGCPPQYDRCPECGLSVKVRVNGTLTKHRVPTRCKACDGKARNHTCGLKGLQDLLRF